VKRGEGAGTAGDGTVPDRARIAELETRIATLERELAASQERYTELRGQVEERISLISHDLRGPLTLILGHAESLLSRTSAAPDNERLSQELGVIVSAARNLNKMLTQVVDATRLDLASQPSTLREVDLAASVDDEVRRTRRAYAGRTIRTHVPRNLPYVYSDPRRVAQVIEALLSNAILFSPSGGDVVVTARLSGDRVALTVRDLGVGIAPEEQPRIFERFFRPDRLRKLIRRGLGLSLANSREFARSSGGDIVCESAGVDQGSSFTLFLPLAPDLPAE